VLPIGVEETLPPGREGASRSPVFSAAPLPIAGMLHHDSSCQVGYLCRFILRAVIDDDHTNGLLESKQDRAADKRLHMPE
jgi:hypothetical protein